MKIMGGLLAVVLLLAGCSSSGGGMTAAEKQAQLRSLVGRSVPSRSVQETAFLSVMHQELPLAGHDRLYLGMAHAICTSLRDGVPWVEVVAYVHRDGGLSGYRSGELIGASVAAFCPDQESKTPH